MIFNTNWEIRLRIGKSPHKVIVLASVLLFTMVNLYPAFASEPVNAKITGCVINGEFSSQITDFGTHIAQDGEIGYPITMYDANCKTDNCLINLDTYEGKKIMVEGSLLPGDLFFVKRGDIRMLGDCKR